MAILIILFTLTLIAGIVFWLYQYTLHIMEEQIGTRLMSIAITAAPTFNPDDLDQLHKASDMHKDAYQRVFNQLNEIRRRNTKIEFAYIQRPTRDPGILEFIADADSNYYIPLEGAVDMNGDGRMDFQDASSFPGQAIDIRTPPTVQYKFGLASPLFEGPYLSQWGVYMSGYAPIRDAKGNVIANLGLDMDISDVYKSARRKFSFIPFLGSQ